MKLKCFARRNHIMSFFNKEHYISSSQQNSQVSHTGLIQVQVVLNLGLQLGAEQPSLNSEADM